MSCEECRGVLSSTSKHLARDLEGIFPDCACEQFCVGAGSPGKIEDDEVLYRLFVDPVDVDDQGRLAANAFETAYTNGLSIIRERANDQDIENLVIDILSVKEGKKPKSILAIYRFKCHTVRGRLTSFRDQETRAFCVYDQTVPRIFSPEAPPVGTHGIIMSRRLFEAPITKRQFENDCNVSLRELIAIEPMQIEGFRGGIIMDLNARSLAGEFVRPVL